MRHSIVLILFALNLVVSGCATTGSPSNGSDDRDVAELSPGLWVDVERRVVRVRGWTCLDSGWLEQVACSPGTREHESLMVTNVSASNIHAALLLIGLQPGSPGNWKADGDKVVLIPATGPRVDVSVEWTDPAGDMRVDGVSRWISDISDRSLYPTDKWIFAGSVVLDEAEADRAGVRYLADRTGSLIGLVTFGDELLAAEEVLPDSSEVHSPEWVATTRAMPPVGTEVRIVLRPDSADQTASE